MGRSFHHLQSYKTGVLLTNFSWWSRSPKSMEHWASTMILPLTNLQVVYCSAYSIFKKRLLIQTIDSFGQYRSTFLSILEIHNSYQLLLQVPTFLYTVESKAQVDQVVLGSHAETACSPSTTSSTNLSLYRRVKGTGWSSSLRLPRLRGMFPIHYFEYQSFSVPQSQSHGLIE